MTEEQRYYLKNREAILEKKKNKATADKVKKENWKLKEYELVKSKMPAINNMGFNFCETIIDEGYKNDKDGIVKILSFKVDEKYDLGGMTHLEILSDYSALNDIKLDIRQYPWSVIRDKFNYNYSSDVKDKRLYYNTFTSIETNTIETNPKLDDEDNASMFKHICQLIWEHNKTSDEKWNSGLFNPNSTVVELNDVLNLIYSNKYSTYKWIFKYVEGEEERKVRKWYMFEINLLQSINDK